MPGVLASIRKNKDVVPAEAGKRSSNAKTGIDHAAAKSAFKAAPKKTRDVLGYHTMLPSGVAYLGSDEWSMTLKISDINYVSAAQNDQEVILDKWARFLNSFDSGSRIQETVINRVLDDADVARLVQKEYRGDQYDKYREDHNKIVRGKLATSSGNTVTEKYLTITVQEPDQHKAETTLTRLEHAVQAELRGMKDCKAIRLTRTERLAVIAHIMRPYESFAFSEDEFSEQPRRATHDYIAPFALENAERSGPVVFRNASGDTYHSVLWVRDYPTWLSDRVITELTEIKCDLTVSLHLEAFEQLEGKSLVERQIAELEMQKITESKKLRKQGLEQEYLPQTLIDNLDEARDLRKEISDSSQKIFSTVMVIGISAPSQEELEQNIGRAKRALRKQSVTAEELRYMQYEGITTQLPLGRRAVPMRRAMTSASAAILVPFTTQELFMPGGHWYGINSDSSNPVVADRTKTPNGNGFILGTSGSGKGVFAKSEITGTVIDRPNDEIIIIDPEHEYEPLANALGGAIVRIHAGSEDRVNPFDIEFEGNTEDDPIKAKSEFVLSMLETLIGGVVGLSPEARSLIDRVTIAMYTKYESEYRENPATASMPTLHDLRSGLMESEESDGKALARALEIYTEGSLGGFSKPTNVDIQNRLIVWDISKLGNQLKSFGMMVVLDQIWNRVVRNRSKGIRTWVYIDEFHMLFNDNHTAEVFQTFYARARKWGMYPTGITQNIESVLNNEHARIMLANCDFLAILGQKETDATSLCDLMNFSSEQRNKFENVRAGQGLLKSGGHIVGFDSIIPESSLLYELYQTTFQE